MNVSTARVAVLIKKLEERELVEKTSDPSDARKTMLKISENGIKRIEEHRNNFIDFFSSVIDRIGEEKFTQFIEFESSFRSPKNGGGAWQPNKEYGWVWCLARSDNGKWKLMTWGY